MKKIVFFAVFVVLSLNSSLFADTVQLGLMAGNDAVLVNVEVQKERDFGIIAIGATMDHVRHDYNIWEALLVLRKDQLVPGTRFGLGFKGYIGKVDSDNRFYIADLSALAFVLEGAVELTSSMNPASVPVELFGVVSYSPSSLSFDETQSLSELRGGLRFYLLKNAYLSIEAKHRNMKFKTQGIKWKRDDTTLAGGVTLRF